VDVQTDTTGADGSYSLADIAIGNYTVSASLTDYQTSGDNVDIQVANIAITLDIILEETPMGIQPAGLLPQGLRITASGRCLQISNLPEPAQLVIYSMEGRILLRQQMEPGNDQLLLPESFSNQTLIISVKSVAQEVNQRIITSR
jgi:hypothetical protein